MSREVNSIAQRLSLRPPQREALETLARAAEHLPFHKVAATDLPGVLAAVKPVVPSLEDFERDFPSLCFALATGVGKTRLMGAFIAFLHATRGIRHFFVLAPGRTIYEKLITDFTPNTPKYVLPGLADFAVTPPRVITGDNYEQIAAAGHVGRAAGQQRFFDAAIEINVFNIDKLNKDSSERKGRPRIREIREVLGESYFDYLAGLEDLVLLMDESHHYRAAAGLKVLNELQPVLGLELTATPYVETGRAGGREAFKNVVYSYPLPRALADGFIKEPTVATRKDFDPRGVEEDELERIKLEDAVHVHERTRVELDVYARQTGEKRVKPFILVISQTVEHAGKLKALIQSDIFFGGRYRDKVIEVHGSQTGSEKEEVVTRLLKVEDPDEPTEIVIHVNKLKEGWDVTNLYTIVPLRAASSKNLIEQSIGRGLRLPFGRRTGVEALDRLTIIAHDRFQELLDEANQADSIIRKGYELGAGGEVDQQGVTVPSRFERMLLGTQPSVRRPDGTEQPVSAGSAEGAPIPPLDPTEAAVAPMAAQAIDAVTASPYKVPVVGALPGVARDIAAAITERATPEQRALPGFEPAVQRVVARAIEAYTAGTIGIPQIVVQPVGEVRSIYHAFDLDVSVINFQPVEQSVLVNYLRDQSKRVELGITEAGFSEPRLENYVWRGLCARDDISYDDHAPLLNALADRVVSHLRGYLPDDDAVENVLRYYQNDIVRLVYQQMEAHHELRVAAFEAKVTRGLEPYGALAFKVPAGSEPLPFRDVLADPQAIKSKYFGGFRKCLYDFQQFDSESERRLAVTLEDDKDVLRWLKPARGKRLFSIWLPSGEAYHPDFAVETTDAKLMIEVKAASQLTHPDVVEKSRAAITWCQHATTHELAHGGKPWRYVLIPHDAITAQMSLSALVARYGASSHRPAPAEAT